MTSLILESYVYGNRPIDKAPQSTTKPSKAPVAAQKDDAVQVGITVTKDGDFAEWYIQTVMKGELCEYYRFAHCYPHRQAD